VRCERLRKTGFGGLFGWNRERHEWPFWLKEVVCGILDLA
jgi:hypothetical protein